MTMPVKRMYCTSSPTCQSPAIRARPPSRIMSAPIDPITRVATDDTADTPVTAFATLRRSTCAPCAKTRCSRFSTV